MIRPWTMPCCSTIRDAARQPGRKAIVAFTSHGTDYASMISPDDVARVAEDEGISVHVIAGDKPPERMTPGFVRVTQKTGGAFYTVANWKLSSALFDRVQDDLTNCYTVSYRSHKPPDGDIGASRLRLRAGPSTYSRGRVHGPTER